MAYTQNGSSSCWHSIAGQGSSILLHKIDDCILRPCPCQRLTHCPAGLTLQLHCSCVQKAAVQHWEGIMAQKGSPRLADIVPQVQDPPSIILAEHVVQVAEGQAWQGAQPAQRELSSCWQAAHGCLHHFGGISAQLAEAILCSG